MRDLGWYVHSAIPKGFIKRFVTLLPLTLMLMWRLCIQFNGIRSTKVQQIFLLMDHYQLPDILERFGYGFNLSINNECNFSGLIVVVIWDFSAFIFKGYKWYFRWSKTMTCKGIWLRHRGQKGMLAVKNVVRYGGYS